MADRYFLYNQQKKHYVILSGTPAKITFTAERRYASRVSLEEAKMQMERCSTKLKGFSIFKEVTEPAQETGKEKEKEEEIQGQAPVLDSTMVSEPVVLKTKRRPFTQKERLDIYVRDKGRCGICGKFVSPEEYTVDHIIPLSRGGTYEYGNLQCTCRRCNLMKADALPEDFIDIVAKVMKYQAKKGNKKILKEIKKIAKKSKKK